MIVDALRLMGGIVRAPYSASVLSIEAMCDWYKMLRHCMGSRSTDIKNMAFECAWRSILLGLQGSPLLLSAVSLKLERVGKEPNSRGNLPEMLAAAVLLAMNTTVDASSEVDSIEARSCTVTSNDLEVIGQSQTLQLAAWMAVLIEESLAGRGGAPSCFWAV